MDEQREFSQMRMPKTFGHLDTDRSIGLYIVLNFITSGIYGIVIFTTLGLDINTIASHHDGKKTMHYCLLIFLVAPFTLGIGALVWFHRLTNRIVNELARRNLSYPITVSNYWLLNVLWPIVIGFGYGIFLVIAIPTGPIAVISNITIVTVIVASLFVGILGSVGPFMYINKVFKSMNLLASDFNKNGT